MYLASDEMLHSQQPRSSLALERRWKSNVEIAPNCPRCASPNTKFCYYNNYSFSQPRYICKGCRRYWTKGGSLRNVPTGGGCRKSRRTKAVRLLPSGGSSDDGSLAIENAISDPSIVGTPGAPTMEPDIDMAAVFAKFVNRTEETNSSSDIIGSLNQDICLEDIFVDIQTQSCTSVDREQSFTEFPSSDHILEEGQTHEFSGHDPNFFGLQNMLSDELVQEPMWSDTTISTNFSWRSMGQQLQGFGSYCDDQSKFSTHGSENWNLFDLPAYDIFSRP